MVGAAGDAVAGAEEDDADGDEGNAGGDAGEVGEDTGGGPDPSWWRGHGPWRSW